MTFDPKLSVSAGLDHLADRLDPIISARFAADIPNHPWTVVLDQLDSIAGKPAKHYSPTDLQTQLRMFTRRLGKLGYPFDDNRQTVGTLGRELTIVRNARAHGDPFTSLDAWRAHDYCVRLLDHFGDTSGLERASALRAEALRVYVAEQGLVPEPVLSDDSAQPTVVDSADPNTEIEMIAPDPTVFIRERATQSGLVGSDRLAFEPWIPVPVGGVSILDDLPKVIAKQKVRAVAIEIVEAEGPIHSERMAQLVAASFGVQKLYSSRAAKIVRQARSIGLLIDDDKFVWPDGIDPSSWGEFRPNDSQVDRPFQHVSPVEIANAMRRILVMRPDLSDADLDAETLQTFGRKRRTRIAAAQLSKARALL